MKKKQEHEKKYDKFTSVLEGVRINKTPKNKTIKRNELSLNDYYNGIINKDRTILAKAITLIESSKSEDNKKADELIQKLLHLTGNSLRIGITGIPGAGKSSFINYFGSMLCEQKYNIAVLAVDPSSSITKGSILGDKTRMEKLSSFKNSFIRPSPSSGTF